MAQAPGNEKAVGRNTQRGVMMEALPAPPFVVREPELLIEFLVVPLDAPAHLGDEDQVFQGASDGPVERKYFAGSCSPSGHSISSHSSGRSSVLR